MKLINIVFSAFFVIMFASCGPQITFTGPQPADVNNQEGFRQDYSGVYLLERDSSYVLTVENRRLVTSQVINVAEPVTFFDSADGWWLHEGRLCGNLLDEDCMPVTMRNDSIFGSLTVYDTLFTVSEHQVLRYYKGRYFLSKQFAEQQWEVRALWMENDRLILATVMGTEDIETMQQLKMVEEIRNDSNEITAYKSSPSRKQLSEFIKTGGFSYRDTFKRIK